MLCDAEQVAAADDEQYLAKSGFSSVGVNETTQTPHCQTFRSAVVAFWTFSTVYFVTMIHVRDKTRGCLFPRADTREIYFIFMASD